ncbi:MAG TPA: hypothetical protein VFJ16_29900 [Longimicrobium sp.]|nr:hypothetical protein [Longimicrobium sp.]
MDTLFLVCAIVGGVILAVQAVLGLVGLQHEIHFPTLHGMEAAGDALNLFSVRALAAGILFFGLTGMLAGRSWFALPAALAAGVAATVAVAAATRALMRMESDGAVQISRAVGQTGEVYLRIPAGRAAPGKVHVTVQGRTVECQAVSEHALASGSSVLVVDVVGPDLVEVIPSPFDGAPDAPLR